MSPTEQRKRGHATLFSGRERAVDVMLRVADFGAVAASFPLAYLVRDGLLGERYLNHPGLYPIRQYWPLLAATLLSWIVAAWALRLYRSDRLRHMGTEMARVARTVVIVAATIAAVGFLTKQGAVSRLFVVLHFLTAMALLAGNRFLLRAVLRALHRKGVSTRIIAVVGTNEVARDLAEAIRSRREWGYHFAGHIEHEVESGPPTVGPLIGSLSRLDRILENHVLDEIIFAVPQERLATIEVAARRCTESGVTARVCLDLARDDRLRLSLDELDGFPLLDFH